MNTQTTLRLLIAINAIIQVLDVIVHAASNQLEPIRVTANAVILLWLALVAFKRLSARVGVISVGALVIYLALNLLFLVDAGTVNPSNGQPRVALFIFVALTAILSIASIALQNRRR